MLAAVGVLSMVVQGLAIGPIVKSFGERKALLFGLACGAIGLFIYGAAPTGLWFCLGLPVNALWGVAGAATQALMTRRVTPEQQGQLQGATSSVQSVSQMLGPFLFTLIFAYFIGDSAPVKLPGAPFLLAGALLALALHRPKSSPRGRWRKAISSSGSSRLAQHAVQISAASR